MDWGRAGRRWEVAGAPLKSKLGGQLGRVSAEVWAAGTGGEERGSLLLASCLHPPTPKPSTRGSRFLA